MIILIYVLSIIYIIAYFLHKIFRALFIPSLELKRRVRERVVYNAVLTALDMILQNVYILIGAIIIFVSITNFLIFVYIYYRFLLIPISKIWPFGCEVYKMLLFFPISDIKKIGIFDFFDKIIFSGKFMSGIAVNIILESTVKYSVSPEIYKQIKDAILKDAKFSIKDICGDTKESKSSKSSKSSKQPTFKKYGLTYEDMVELKQQALIKQCTNTQMNNYLSNTDTNFTSKIKNKLLKNVCATQYANFS
tara:strand:+ start:195 stop:941 length:747 start_codon:yes stop_codon:yes gene_type:complete